MTAPTAPDAVARAAADSIVLLSDPDAVASNPFYWHRSRPAWEAVSEALSQTGDPRVLQAADAVRGDPRDVALHARLCEVVLDHLAQEPGGKSGQALRETVARVHAGARLGYQPGTARTSPADRPRLPKRHLAGPETPIVNVVIPFRDRNPEHGRLDNLIACLAALADQSLDQRRYAVTVVESDAVPVWRDQISPLADEYVFARNGGAFNKSWAVNVGVVRTRFPAPLICVLDADALVDREFLARNVERFGPPGVASFTPLSTVLYLDADSSARAIEQRCVAGAASIDPLRARGFLTYCSRGICAWMRRTVFEEMRGMDERYEGWGGEDMELLLRLMVRTAFHQFHDLQLHMHHRVQGGILDKNGNSPNARIPFLTWEPAGPIGDPGKYAPRSA